MAKLTYASAQLSVLLFRLNAVPFSRNDVGIHYSSSKLVFCPSLGVNFLCELMRKCLKNTKFNLHSTLTLFESASHSKFCNSCSSNVHTSTGLDATLLCQFTYRVVFGQWDKCKKVPWILWASDIGSVYAWWCVCNTVSICILACNPFNHAFSVGILCYPWFCLVCVNLLPNEMPCCQVNVTQRRKPLVSCVTDV